MDDSLNRKVLAYLRQHNVMTIATTGTHGPWAAAVFYANRGFTLYFLSAPTTRHSEDIEARGAVAVTIQEDYRNWREIQGIQIEGRAVRLQGVERATAMVRYLKKYPFVRDSLGVAPEIARALNHVTWYKIEPSRLYFIDNSLGLGHRDDIVLSRSTKM
nr:pyridoxamine 5'-phosphate oxidase family protein [Rhodoferax sp.]